MPPTDSTELEPDNECRIAGVLARRLRDARAGITYRWLERISSRVALDTGEIFPSEDLLDHVPLLIEAVADYLESPAEEGAAAQAVMSKAAELGGMRHRQGFSPFEVLKEFEILGGLVQSFLTGVVAEVGAPCRPEELFVCSHRVQQALGRIQLATAARHLALGEQRVNRQEQRLRSVHRVLASDVRWRLGRLLAHARMLRSPAAGDTADADCIVGSLEILTAQLEELVTMSEPVVTARQQRHVTFAGAAAEAVRWVRSLAEERGVAVELREPLPEVEVNGAVVELCLAAGLAAAVRYADGLQPLRRVEVGCEFDDALGELIVEIREHARAVPAGIFTPAFEEFVHGAEQHGAGDDPGLGFIRETLATVGGRVWRESVEDGMLVRFSLPCRRSADARGTIVPAGS